MADNKFTPAILMALLSIIVLGTILSGLKIILPGTPLDQKQQARIFSRTVLFIILWVILLSVLSYQGFFADFSRFPPRVVFAVLTPLPIVLFIAFSKAGTRILQSTPPQWLIFMQAFRIFVELLLWLAFLRNLLPSQMTFEGRNFDVLSGLLALPVAWYCFVKGNGP